MAPAKKSTAKKAAATKATAKKPAAAKRAATGGRSTGSATTAKAAAPAKKAAPKKAAAKAAPAKKAAATNSAAKAPAKNAKKAARKPLFDAKFLAEQRALLLEERATYTRQAANLQAEADSLAELREPGDVQFDEESGEGDTLAVERERDLALSARAREQIEEIDHALAKLDNGTYGICEVSGEPIPKARLQAIPQARERVEYKVGGFSRH